MRRSITHFENQISDNREIWCAFSNSFNVVFRQITEFYESANNFTIQI